MPHRPATQRSETNEPDEPGWYRDPDRAGEHRYWDGTAWHDQYEALHLDPPEH